MRNTYCQRFHRAHILPRGPGRFSVGIVDLASVEIPGKVSHCHRRMGGAIFTWKQSYYYHLGLP